VFEWVNISDQYHRPTAAARWHVQRPSAPAVPQLRRRMLISSSCRRSEKCVCVDEWARERWTALAATTGKRTSTWRKRMESTISKSRSRSAGHAPLKTTPCSPDVGHVFVTYGVQCSPHCKVCQLSFGLGPRDGRTLPVARMRYIRRYQTPWQTH
jgi:hypothetical protein